MRIMKKSEWTSWGWFHRRARTRHDNDFQLITRSSPGLHQGRAQLMVNSNLGDPAPRRTPSPSSPWDGCERKDVNTDLGRQLVRLLIRWSGSGLWLAAGGEESICCILNTISREGSEVRGDRAAIGWISAYWLGSPREHGLHSQDEADQPRRDNPRRNIVKYFVI